MATDDEPPDQLQSLIGYHVWRLAGSLKSSLRSRLAKLKLQGSEARILMMINSRPGISQSELGRLFEVNRAALAPLVAGLINKRLVIKLTTDGRAQPLKLSRRGRALAIRAHDYMIQNDEWFFSSLDHKEVEHLRKILAKLLQRSNFHESAA